VRKIFKTAAACTAVGFAAFGAAAGIGGVAGAATVAMTSCSTSGSALAGASASAKCTAGTTSISNPTGMKITVNPSFFTTLLGNSEINAVLKGALSAKVTYRLSCQVNGKSVTSTSYTGFTVTSASNNSQTINMQRAVGSPAPNQCTLANLTVSSPVSAALLTEASLLNLHYTFGVSSTGDNGVPGPMYFFTTKNKSGAVPTICADDTRDGNAGTAVQAYTCVNDPNQKWLQVSTHQFVHNGICLSDVGGKAKLAGCKTNPGRKNGQVWETVRKSGLAELVNTGNGQCLTAPKAMNNIPLIIARCTGARTQLWKVQGVTPM
jgi:Ricin-type beta-trefoil lectin domain